MIVNPSHGCDDRHMNASIRRRALEAAAKVSIGDIARGLGGALAAYVDDRDTSDAEIFVTVDARTFVTATVDAQAPVTPTVEAQTPVIIDAALDASIGNAAPKAGFANPPLGSATIAGPDTIACCKNFLREAADASTRSDVASRPETGTCCSAILSYCSPTWNPTVFSSTWSASSAVRC